jgi:hypothetical protein
MTNELCFDPGSIRVSSKQRGGESRKLIPPNPASFVECSKEHITMFPTPQKNHSTKQQKESMEN